MYKRQDVALVLLDGDTVIEKIWNDSEDETFTFWTDKPPVEIRFDPSDWILCEKSEHPQVSERSIGGAPIEITVNSSLSSGFLEGKVFLDQDSPLSLELFDISGRKVRDIFSGRMSKGVHSIEFEWPSLLPSGLYFIILKNASGHPIKSVPVIHIP